MKKNKVLFFSFLMIVIVENISSQNLDHLKLEHGFKATIFATNLDAPRQMAEGKNGTIFVGERSGHVLALIY
jgi:glucose/arabinose dehydrogenase